MTTTRRPNHIVITNSGTIHAANDLTVSGIPKHVLACTGRAISGAAISQTHGVTCRKCCKGINNGQIVWDIHDPYDPFNMAAIS